MAGQVRAVPSYMGQMPAEDGPNNRPGSNTKEALEILSRMRNNENAFNCFSFYSNAVTFPYHLRSDAKVADFKTGQVSPRASFRPNGKIDNGILDIQPRVERNHESEVVQMP